MPNLHESHEKLAEHILSDARIEHIAKLNAKKAYGHMESAVSHCAELLKSHAELKRELLAERQRADELDNALTFEISMRDAMCRSLERLDNGVIVSENASGMAERIVAATEQQIAELQRQLADRSIRVQYCKTCGTAPGSVPASVEREPSESAAADLLEAVKILKEDYADSEGCYCGQLIGGSDSDGLPLRKCGYCKAVNAIAKATALSNAATGPEAGSTRRDK